MEDSAAEHGQDGGVGVEVEVDVDVEVADLEIPEMLGLGAAFPEERAVEEVSLAHRRGGRKGRLLGPACAAACLVRLLRS